MAAAKLSPDSVVVKYGQHDELTPKEYSFLLQTLHNNLIKKDMKQLTFLCADFFDNKNLLAKEDITAHDIFSQMKRNGTISNGNLTLLSQLMFLLGKKKLQREVLLSKNIEWKEGTETPLSKFRLMLFRLYQDTQKEDFEKMKQYCSLRGDLPRAELGRVVNALELFTVLIDYAVINTDDVDYLLDVVETLGSMHMLKLVTDYKETISPKDTGHQEKNKLSEFSPEIAQTTQSLHGLSLTGGSSSKLKYNRFSSTETSYMDERVAGSSLKRPTDFLKRSGADIPSLEDSSMSHSVQSEEESAMEGKEQLNSTTAKTAEIEKKLKDVHLHSQEQGHEIRRPSGTVTVTSEPEQNKNSENLDVYSGKHKDLKPTQTECRHETQKDEEGSLLSPPSLTTTLPQQLLANSYDEKGDASGSYSPLLGATAMPYETLDDEKSEKTESSFTSGEMLEKMDPQNVNLTARTEIEETKLKELKKSDCSNATSDCNSRESPMKNFRSVHHPPHERYEMSQIPRGKCLLLTYDKFDTDHLKGREGNDKDVAALIPLFKETLHFEVENHLNLDYKKTLEVIKRVAGESHGNYDCFVLIFCSHGNENAVFTKDGWSFDIQELLTPFKAENCKSLAGKPKIFFINSCRREDVLFQEFVPVNRHDTIASDGADNGVASNLSLVPNEADFCVALSTVPGYSSARDKHYGTLYVLSLVHCLKMYYETNHLIDILTKVNKDLNERMKNRNHKTGKDHSKVMSHVSSVINTLEKYLFFE